MAAARAKPKPGVEDRLAKLEERLASLEARMANLDGFRIAGARPGPATERLRLDAPAPAQVWEPPAPSRARSDDLERTLGANWLAKAGIAVLVFGVVFFLKYAFDQGWIDRPARLGLGFAGGLGLWAFGDFLRWRDRERFGIYGQVLAGGGGAIVYFTSYASYAFPEYRAVTGLGLEGGALLLGFVALGLLAYATLRATPVLILEALLLGTAAALLGEAWSGFGVTYQTLLTVAAVAVAARRRWGLLQLAASGAAYVAFVFLLVVEVDPAQVIVGALVTLAAVTAACFLHHEWRIGSFFNEGESRVLAALVSGGSFLAAWGVVSVAYEQLGRNPLFWRGPTTAALALVAIALAFARVAPEATRWGWGLSGIVMALAWAPMQFDGSATAYAWAGTVALGAAVLVARDHWLVRASAAAAALLLLIHLSVFEFEDVSVAPANLALASLPFAAALASLLMLLMVGHRRHQGEDPVFRFVLAAVLYVPMLYFGASLEGFAIPIAWAAQAVVLVVLGFALGLRDLRLGALVIFGIVVGRVFLIDLTQLAVAVRIITFLAVGTLLLVASFLYARRRQAPAARPAPAGRR